LVEYCPFADASDLSSYEGREVNRVCPAGDAREGCDFDSIQRAVDAAASGSRIEIVGDGEAYDQCAVIPDTMEDVEIVGVCGRAHIKDTVCQSKGIFVNLGRDIKLVHLEVSGAEIGVAEGRNAAAVRDQGLGGLDLRYVYFHHNQNGILGGNGAVRIDWSRFEANGSALDPGYTHNTYFSADVDNVIIENSIFLRAAYEGNNMKSRAKRMEFRCSVSASLNGADSREMDISEGGELLIENSLIQQGVESVNSGMIGFATEAGNEARRHDTQSIVIRETDFLNDKDRGTFLAYNAFNGLSVELEKVRFIGPGTPVENTNDGEEGSRTMTDVTYPESRTEAGLSAYDGGLASLPAPPGCDDFEYF